MRGITCGAIRIALAGVFLCSAGGFGQIPAEPAQSAKPETLQQRREQLATDSARLLKLATELKADVDKSTKDQLSSAVVKKADEVEKLARKVRDEMKSIPAN